MFDLYKDHQDATLIESFVEAETIGGEDTVPSLHESASVSEDGTVHVTLANLSIDKAYPVEALLAGLDAKSVTAKILTNKYNAFNTFEAPNTVKIEDFKDITTTADGFRFEIPACSVMELTIA